MKSFDADQKNQLAGSIISEPPHSTTVKPLRLNVGSFGSDISVQTSILLKASLPCFGDCCCFHRYLFNN